jgi:hypothetical protein
MIVGADTRAKSTLVTPDGKVASLLTVRLSVEQARTLRAYERDILGALRVRAVRKCRECGRRDPMEWEVHDDFIALACDCTMFSFPGPTPLPPSSPMRALPAPDGRVVDVNGCLVPRQKQTFTTEQARLLRDYAARILRPLGIVEATYCQVCEDILIVDHDGVDLRVGHTEIRCICRHAIRRYKGTTL